MHLITFPLFFLTQEVDVQVPKKASKTFKKSAGMMVQVEEACITLHTCSYHQGGCQFAAALYKSNPAHSSARRHNLFSVNSCYACSGLLDDHDDTPGAIGGNGYT